MTLSQFNIILIELKLIKSRRWIENIFIFKLDLKFILLY